MIEAKLDRAVKVGDSGATNIAKAELALQIKKYQALVVRARLKIMSFEATNFIQELPVEELRHAVDRYIAIVTSPDGQCRTTNESFVENFLIISSNF